LVTDSPLLNLMGFVLLDTSFDVLGFKYTNLNRGSASYRIIQKMFQFSVLALVFVHVGAAAVVACAVASYLLVSDVLYYFALSLKLTPFSWYKPSPVVFLFTVVLKRPSAPVWAVLLSAVVGFAAAATISFFY